MNDTLVAIALIITALGSLVSAVGTYLNGRVIRKVQNNTDGIIHQLVTKTEISSEQVGKEKEQAAQKDRDDGAKL